MSSKHIRGPLTFDTTKIVLTGNYTVVNESVVIVNKTVGAATQITLPVALSPGGLRGVWIADDKGDAATNNITIVPDGTVVTTIMGASSYVINVNFGAVLLLFTGTEWTVVATSAAAGSFATVIGTSGLQAGQSGTAGTITLYPATASKGDTTLTMSNNSGNTTTNVNVAAQAGARTYTVPDAGASAAFLMSIGRALSQLLAIGPAPTDAYGSTMTIDVTKSLHVIAAANGTSATSTLTPSAAGSAGDILVIITEADSSGTVTITFASTFHPSGTQATTLSKFSTILFMSDGTRWVELCRTTALT